MIMRVSAQTSPRSAGRVAGTRLLPRSRRSRTPPEDQEARGLLKAHGVRRAPPQGAWPRTTARPSCLSIGRDRSLCHRHPNSSWMLRRNFVSNRLERQLVVGSCPGTLLFIAG